MERKYRTKEETIKYFEELSNNFSVLSHRESDPVKSAMWRGKSEAYEMAAFEIKTNME